MSKIAKGYVRKRNDMLWEGQYTYQKKRRSIYATTEKEVRDKLEWIMDSIQDGSYIKPNEHTVKTWMTHWCETYAKTSLRPSTFTNYESVINGHIIPYFGHMLLGNVSVETLQKFFNEKMISGRTDGRPGGLSGKTLKNFRHILNVAFEQAIHGHIITYNPVGGVRLPVPEEPELKVLTSQQKSIVCNRAAGEDTLISKAIIILFNTGVRKGELLGLRWKNVNFQEGYIHIIETLSRLKNFEIAKQNYDYTHIDTYAPKTNKTRLYLGPVKTKKGRRKIYMTESVRNALLHLYTQGANYSVGKESFNPHGFVFCTEFGRIMDPRQLEEEFKKFFIESNLKPINIHAARHTFATEAMYKSSDVLSVAELMGHAKPSTTMNWYGHTFEDRKRALMAQFN